MSGGALQMGLRLQSLRQSAGMSQSELATAAGVPVSSLKNWEQGRRLPQLDAAWRLAKALSISLDKLTENVFEEETTKRPAKGRKKSSGTTAPDSPSPDQ